MQHTPRKATLLAWGVLTAVLVLTGLVFIPAAIKIPFDFTVNKLFVQDGKDQEVLQRVKDRFAENDGDAIVMLSLADTTWFAPKKLEAVRDLHQRIERRFACLVSPRRSPARQGNAKTLAESD